ncbi:MAG TPA: PAS domain S-box protein [Flavobacteriales bacterium]|nr:PAS domain S-box protein [Flavobacteriales bacterium]
MNTDLLDLDYTRYSILLLFIVPAIINLLIALYVHLTFNKKKQTDQIFMVFLLSLGIWQLTNGFVHLAKDGGSALAWYGLGGFPLVYGATSGVLFMLSFTGWYKKISLKQRFVVVTAPAIIISICMFFRLDSYILVKSQQWYWIVNPQFNFFTNIIYIWTAVMGLAIICIPLIFYFRGKGEAVQKKQALLLGMGFCIPLLVGIICEMLLPLLFSMDVVPLTNTILTIFSATAFYAIWKYRSFDYSPRHQWEGIIESMNEGLFIVNNNDEIMYANKTFCQLMEYEFDEIRGKLAKELFLENDSQKRMIERVNQQRKEKVSSQYEIQFKTKSGKKIWVLMSGAPCLDEKGNVIGSIAIQTNIHQLKEKQARLNHVIEAGRMITIDTDFKSETVRFSENAREILGITSFTHNIWEMFNIVHPDDRSRLVKSFERLIVERKSLDIEFRIIRPDTQEIVWLERRGELILDPNSNILGSTGLLVDITHKKQTESEHTTLSKELEDYKYALDESSIVAITDHLGKITYVNDNFCNISKYTREELIGKDHNIINSSHHSKEFFRSLWLTISSGRVWRGEIRNKAKDGSIYWVDTTIVPFINGNKKPYQYVAIRTDITNRKQFEENLEKTKIGLEISEAKHKDAQAIAHFGNWELDFTTGIAVWSEEACRIYGLDPSDNIHNYQAWLSFIHPEDVNFVLDESKKSQQLQQRASFAHRIVWKDGTIKHIHSISQFKFDANGNRVGMYGVAHDITEQKKAEEKLIAVNKELETYIYKASHDLRGPLASIIGLTNVGKKEVQDATALKYLDMIETSTNRLDHTLSGLVKSMNIRDTKNFNEKIDFSKLIEDSSNKFSQYDGFDKLNIVTHIEPNISFVSNNLILESVFQNIIENAIKFRNKLVPQSTLKIRINGHNGHLKLTFEDNGIGIMKELQSKIFDMYFRATNDARGSGLGLYLVKTSIHKLGGKIDVESQEGKGTKFTIWLPNTSVPAPVLTV